MYLDPVEEQEVQEAVAPAAKRDKLKAKRKIPIEEQDMEIDGDPTPLEPEPEPQPRRTPRMMRATGERLVNTLRSNTKARRALKEG